MIFLSNIEKETHWINWGYFGLTCESYEDNIEIKQLEPKSQISSMLKDKIDIKKNSMFFLEKPKRTWVY